MVEPFKRRQGRSIITKMPKFYLFDVGVSGILTKREIQEEKGPEYGKAFEHFIFMELIAYKSYKEKDFNINFWRTKSGLEVDFVLGPGETAIEVKGSSNIDKKDFHGLLAFIEEYSPKKAILVCNEKEERVSGSIRIMPWKIFLDKLWGDEII